MDELIKFALTTILGAVGGAGGFYIALRAQGTIDRTALGQMLLDTQKVAENALESQRNALESQRKAEVARDEAVAALNEYKAMREADVELLIRIVRYPNPSAIIESIGLVRPGL